jgi:site-specific DNA-methyltransferase (adenine-specific)
LRKTEIFLRNAAKADKFRRRGYLCSGDGLQFLKGLRSNIGDVIFLDPPFNLGKDYGVQSQLEDGNSDAYEAYMKLVVKEAVRVVRPGGAVFLYHLPYWAVRLGNELMASMTLRHWIAVSMKNGFVRGRRLYPAHYALLYLTKGAANHFSRPRLAAAKCRHCGELVKDYGGYKSIIEEKGINLSDVWEDLSPVRHRNRKHRTANQLPPILTDRVVSIAGTPRGLLIDPFVGSGTSLLSAVNGGMMFVGNDLSRRNLSICRTRLTSRLGNPDIK